MRVKKELKKLDILYVVVDLGLIEMLKEITSKQHELLRVNLQNFGFELLDDQRSMLVDRIMSLIVEMVYNKNVKPKTTYSDFISKKLDYDYTYLANIFSEVKGLTIQKYIILNKVERVKEMLIYDKLLLKEIAFRMNYSSAAHLSIQFRNITGLTPSYFKALAKKRRQKILKDV